MADGMTRSARRGAWPLDPRWAILEGWGSAAVQQINALLASGLQFNAGMFDGEGDAEASYSVVNGVAVIGFSGPMTKHETCMGLLFGGASTARITQAVTEATSDASVRSILLLIDSPGGQVSGTSELANAIYRARSRKPVVAYADDLCASAAYWVASQCDAIYCNDTAYVGSIGVYMVMEDTSRMAENVGLKVHVIKSATFKGAGTDGTPVTDAQIAEFRRNIKSTHSQFVRAVARGRGITEAAAEKLADGRCHVGQEAVDAGLADGVCSLEDAIRAASTASVTRTAPLSAVTDNEVASSVGENDTAESTPVPSGKGETSMATWKERLISLIHGMPDGDVTGAAEEQGEASAQAAGAPDSGLREQLGVQNQIIAGLNEQIAELKAARAADAKAKQFEADSVFIESLVKGFKMTPAEAKTWKGIAENTPEAFAASRAALAERPVMADFTVQTVDAEGLIENGTGATKKVADLTAALVRSERLPYQEAMSRVLRENPSLAAEMKLERDAQARENSERN